MFWYKRCCNWLGAIKGTALWSRGFSRGSLFRTWPKPETAHEKSLAPRVPIESNSTSNCRQPPRRKCTFPPFLRLVLDFFLFCTATCIHSCLKSLYFLPFLNPLNKRCVWPTIVCKPVLFCSQSVLKGAKHRRRLCKINRVSFASLASLIRFLASFQTFPLTVRAHRQLPCNEIRRKHAMLIMAKTDRLHFLGD